MANWTEVAALCVLGLIPSGAESHAGDHTLQPLLVALNVHPQVTLTEREMDNAIPYKVDGQPPVEVPLRDLAKIPMIGRAIPKAFRVHDWMTANEGLQLPARDFQLTRVTDSKEKNTITFEFLGSYQVRVFRDSGRVRGVIFSQQPKLSEQVLPDSDFARRAEGLYDALGLRWANLEYKTFVARTPGARTVRVTHLAVLSGINYPLGPGISMYFDASTGRFNDADFHYDVKLYETPFRELIDREEAYQLAIKLFNPLVEYSAYRIDVLNPALVVPWASPGESLPSERLRNLAASGTRCVVTRVHAVPYLATSLAPAYHWVVFDSQTGEYLSTNYMKRGTTPTAADQANRLDLKSVICLPDLALKIPLIPVKGVVRPSEDNLKRVMIRQNDLTFSARLELGTHVLWIEDKPFQGTRAFTAGLTRWFGSSW